MTTEEQVVHDMGKMAERHDEWLEQRGRRRSPRESMQHSF